MPTWVQWVSFSLAVIGSLSGLWALVLNHQRTSILKRKEKERLEAKKKAKFHIDRTKEMGSRRGQDKFIITNVGEAEVKNVNVEFYNYDRFGDGSKKKTNVLMNKIPSNIISGQSIKENMLLSKDSSPPWELVIHWDDDFKEGNSVEITLN